MYTLVENAVRKLIIISIAEKLVS